MATAAEIRKALRAKNPTLEPTPQEKTQAIDEVFSKITPPEIKPLLVKAQKEFPKPQSAGIGELYSVFGAGSILIDLKNVQLPYTVKDNIELNKLKSEYSIDAPLSPLRFRKF